MLAAVIAVVVLLREILLPFVAGMARMHVPRFEAFNAAGAAAWVGSITYAGYFFGNIPWIRGNLTALILGIIAVSLAPLAIAFVRSRLSARRAA